MVQFGDKNCSSMLALCTHAAWDAYNYANRVESHKALLKPESPHSPSFPPPHSWSLLFGCGENQQFWMAAKAGSFSRHPFVIRDTSGKEVSWGNILKVGVWWNGNPCQRICPISHCMSMYSSAYSGRFSLSAGWSQMASSVVKYQHS